jgi:energy-converting hydrogenase Eha subunit E
LSHLRTGLALWAGTLAVLVGSLALARGETHVLLIGRSEKDPSVKRIELELRILGLEVEFLPASKSRGSLADKARARGATAAAEVQADPPAILLWTDPIRFPDVGGGPDLRVDEGSAGTAEPGLLALRAVELLHGRVLPVPASTAAPLDGGTGDAGAADAPTTDAGAAPEQPRPTTEPPRPSPFSAFVGPAILTSSSVDPTLHVWLGARLNLATRIDLELAGAIPTTATAVPGVTGTAGARIGTLGLAANFRFTEPASPLFASAGLGIGALVSVVSGDATKASNAALGTRAGALPYLRAGAGYWIANHVALRGDALLGTALPAPVIKVKSDDVATFGAPTLIFAAALEVRP